jgi:hypothetical protein
MTLQTYYSVLYLDHLHWKNGIYFCYVTVNLLKFVGTQLQSALRLISLEILGI